MRARVFQHLKIFGLILGLLLSVVSAQPVQAGTLIVTMATDELDNTATSTGCSLREAITEANAAVPGTYPECGTATGDGADTITFADNYTITLDGSQLPPITSEITIIGTGAADTIIQASTCNPVTETTCTHDYRVLEVASGGVLALENLTVRHGRLMGASGGGVYISSSRGELILKYSTISDNSTQSNGGGIYCNGDLYSEFSQIDNNRAGESGGGIYSSYANVLITNGSTVSDNLAGQDGGGIYIFYSGTALFNSFVSSNRAGESGGGIFNSGFLDIYDSIINDNSAEIRGGGIFNSFDLKVWDSKIDNNAAISDGGGLFNEGGLVMENNTISGNSAASGGGLYNKSTDAEISNSTVSGNIATSNGGGFYNNAHSFSVKNSTIIGNSTTSNGGGFYNGDSGTVIVNASLVAGNNAAAGREIYNAMNVSAGYNNLFGHSGETNAQAYWGFVPYGTDINATSSGTNTTLTDILDPVLAENGIRTWTHALVADSPAIDAINLADCLVDTDQRGVIRPQGAGCDIGAFEFDLDPSVTINQATGQTDPTSTSPIFFTVTFSEPIDSHTLTAADITLGGTVPGDLTVSIAETAPTNGTTFEIAVRGMSSSGTVTASITAGAIQDLAGNDNSASTSVDNSVLYQQPTIYLPLVKR